MTGVALHWREDLDAAEWDKLLAASNGHPLQSSFWGEGRKRVDGIEYQRWVCYVGECPIWMVRFEVRYVARIIKVAWVPKCGVCETHVHEDFLSRLRGYGYQLCVEEVYTRAQHQVSYGVSFNKKPSTIIIDIKEGKDALWNSLDKQWRYGVRAAGRAGVVVQQTSAEEDVTAFFSLCSQISRNKNFELPGSEKLLHYLIRQTPGENEVKLFVARYENRIAAGAVVLRCGSSLHYFWGASDRTFSKQRPGEAVQWGVMEWALSNGIKTYDLEGIDPIDNPGVCAFKRKMGGQEIELPGRFAYPLKLSGALALKMGILLGKI